MKKLFIIMVSFIIFFTCSAFTSCDQHHHTYSEWQTTPATCEEDGVRTKQCECGDIVTEIIPAKGHHFVGGVCTDCGE